MIGDSALKKPTILGPAWATEIIFVRKNDNTQERVCSNEPSIEIAVQRVPHTRKSPLVTATVRTLRRIFDEHVNKVWCRRKNIKYAGVLITDAVSKLCQCCIIIETCLRKIRIRCSHS